MNNSDPEQRAMEIENFVASNDLNSAARRLMDFVTDFSQNRLRKREVIDIRAKYNDLREDLRTYGKTEEIRNRQTQLRNQILEFLEQIKDEYSQNIREETEVREESTRQQNVMEETSLQNFSLSEIQINPGEKIEARSKPKTQLELEKERFIKGRDTASSQTAISINSEDEDKDIVFAGSGISKTYKSRSVKFRLHPIDIKLKLGEITAVVGENGNGKSTLLRIIAGELAHSKGKLRYPGLTLNGQDDWYSIKQQIAYIPQELPEWNGLLADNLHFAASIHGITGVSNQDQVDFIISRLGLEQYKKANWNEISGGYRTRFSLAKALVWNPKLIILDEPLANLDINTQVLFLQDLRDLANSSTNPLSVIVSSQHLYEMENIADNIMFLKGGSAVYNDSVANFGKDRQENSYEIAGDLSKEQLMDILEEIDYRRIDQEGNSFIIHTSRNVEGFDLLRIFVNNSISLRYFRDISKSTRKLFEE